MSERLPEGWAAGSVLDIASIHDNRRVPLNGDQRAAMPGEFPYYGANGLVDHVGDFLFDGQYVLLAEDGGYFDDPSRGVAYRVDGRFWVNNHAHILRGEGGVDAHFLERWLNAVDWMPHVSGMTRLKLTQAGLREVVIPVPPLPEQRRIVAKLDRLSARSAAARRHLARVAALAARAKQAILAAAFNGDLTADWREAHCGAQGAGPALADCGLDDRERGSWGVEVLPSSWSWRGFRECFDDVTGSRRKLPQKDYAPEGRFIVVDQGVSLIGGFSDDASLVHPVEPPVIIFDDHTRCLKFIEESFVQGADGVKVLKPLAAVETRLAFWLLNAVELPDKGYSRHMKFLRASVFPVPPADEQREIVRRIEAAFARIDRLADESARAARLIDSLDARLLAKAFLGELVPQNPADEPATALLARLRQTRAAAPRRGRGRKGAA